MRPLPAEIPPPLPAGLPARLASDHAIFLFLDYDGTISEITPDIANAAPVPGVRDLVALLAARPERFRIALISGRQTRMLARLFGIINGVTLVGNHGLEIMDPQAGPRLTVEPALLMPALDAVRDWLRRNVPCEAGFVIEDKHLSVALHYRLADPDLASRLRRRLSEFVEHIPELVIGEGKMVIEVLSRHANKGEAVRALMRESGQARLAVYFGDDVTDEDAFWALRDTGMTVKVCKEPSPSWAKYRVSSPFEVTSAMAEMEAATRTDRR